MMTANSEHDKLLSKLYYSPEYPSSYGGVNNLYYYAKQNNPYITLDNVKQWLSSQFTYTLHKQSRKNFSRNKIYVSYIDELWETDLIDFQKFSYHNNGYKYILIIIDVFSKYLFAYPIKNKTSLEIVSKFKNLFKRRRPAKLRSDKGKEFENSIFKTLCKENNVRFFTTPNSDIKCAVAERVIRTIKSKLFRYFTKNGTRRYIDILPKIIESYNKSFHSSIKMSPVNVLPENERQVFKNLYGEKDLLTIMKKEKFKNRYKVGDTVRQRHLLNVLDKSYYPLWTDVVYNINKVFHKLGKPNYELSLEDEIFDKRFYPEEIQKVFIDTNTLYLIEKIIGYRTKEGQRQALVKFKGYPRSFNQWLPLNQIQNL